MLYRIAKTIAFACNPLRKRKVFVSTVTNELESYRTEVDKSLRKSHGCNVEVQGVFKEGQGNEAIADSLRKKISKCDAVICLVGDHYGSEPSAPIQGYGRRSWTQLEYYFAIEEVHLRKRVWVLVKEGSLKGNNPSSESNELQILQRQYRSQFTVDKMYLKFSDVSELREKIANLPVNKLTPAEAVVRAIVVILLIFGSAAWWFSLPRYKNLTVPMQIISNYDIVSRRPPLSTLSKSTASFLEWDVSGNSGLLDNILVPEARRRLDEVRQNSHQRGASAYVYLGVEGDQLIAWSLHTLLPPEIVLKFSKDDIVDEMECILIVDSSDSLAVNRSGLLQQTLLCFPEPSNDSKELNSLVFRPDPGIVAVLNGQNVWSSLRFAVLIYHAGGSPPNPVLSFKARVK